jgi:hypothetical protein
MPNPDNEPQIPKNQSPISDDRTGLVSRDWYRFFLNLLNKVNYNSTTATLSGASTTVLGIPASAVNIRIAVSNGTASIAAIWAFQVCVADVAVTTGYVGGGTSVAAGSTTAAAQTTRWGIGATASAAATHVVANIIKVSPTTYNFSSLGWTPTATQQGAGTVTTSSGITGVVITTVAGAATLTGSVTVYWD